MADEDVDVLWPTLVGRAVPRETHRRCALGAVWPRRWCEAARAGDHWQARVELIVRGDAQTITAGTVRFSERGDGGMIEREVALAPRALGAPAHVSYPVVGRAPLSIDRDAVACGAGLWRVAIGVANLAELDPARSRDDAAQLALGALHVVVEVAGGEVVSLGGREVE